MNNVTAAQSQQSRTPHGVNVAASVGRNTIFGVMANAVQVLTRLVTVPVVIHYLGLGGYGIWNVVMASATYMRFGSVGAKTAFQKYVAEATGDGNYDRASKLLSTGSAVMFVFSVLVLIPAAAFSSSLARLMGITGDFAHSAAGAIAVLALIMVMSNVGAAFEAIVMGGHRIDLVRKFTTVLLVLEAICIIAVLHAGFGILAMALVMGISELVYITACFFAARAVVPQVHLSVRNVRREVLYELFRFAGSYQLVNILEVLYASIVPLALLRVFGADSAGVYAVVTRVVSSATLLLDSFLPPVLSGGALLYATGDVEKMRLLLTKAFKVTSLVSFLPLGFIAVFGPLLTFVWTGQVHPQFRVAFWILCLTGVFRGYSLLGLVLYRVSGRVVMDNVRQVLRIFIIAATAWCAHYLGFFGVLGGLAIAELAGMFFMIAALVRTFQTFRPEHLFSDGARIVASGAAIFAAGLVAAKISLPTIASVRAMSGLRLLITMCVCAAVAWPMLRATRAVTAGETEALLRSFRGRSSNVTSEPICAAQP